MSLAQHLQSLIAKHGINDHEAIADECRDQLTQGTIPLDVLEEAFMKGVWDGISQVTAEHRQEQASEARKRAGTANKGQRKRRSASPMSNASQAIWDFPVQFLNGKRLGDCTKDDITAVINTLRGRADGFYRVADVYEKGILAKWGRGKTVRTAVKLADAQAAVASMKQPAAA